MIESGLPRLGKLIVFVGLLAWGALPAWAAPSAKAGAAISAQCAACHGNNGIAADTSMPNLAGQHYRYLLSQLEAFKNGTLKSPIMNQMTKALSQEQMQDLAAYFASIPIRVGSPAPGK